MDTIIHLDKQFLLQLGFQLANTALVVAVLGFLLYEPVKNFLRKRSDKIAEQLRSAAEAETNAHQLKTDYELKLKAIEAERDQILGDARKLAHDRESQLIASAKAEAQQLIKRAHAEIELEKSKATDDMKIQIVQLSTLLASRYVMGAIDTNTQHKLLDEVIGDLGDVKWIS